LRRFLRSRFWPDEAGRKFVMSAQSIRNKPDIIGVLDLQGGVHEHLDHLDRLGIPSRRVKQKADFPGLAGLIIPGGESSCVSRLLDIFDLKDVLRQNYRQGMKLWGTCAGAILLAGKVINEKPCLQLIDIEIARNSFGSQLDSFVTEALIPEVASEPIPLTFIRAPKIISIGKEIRVLLQIDDYIAAAESKNVLVTVFHPELTNCIAWHRYFARKCGLQPAAGAPESLDRNWGNVSWTRLARIAS
jgi:pyridoxal 5'-phosphate synthase pdxT subunit